MFQFSDDNSTQCEVNDLTPDSDQKRINIVVRPAYTVNKLIDDISTQFTYESFDLLLQPKNSSNKLILLNNCRNEFVFQLSGFDSSCKNTLVLLPAGTWDGDITKRFELTMAKPKSNSTLPGSTNTASNITSEQQIAGNIDKTAIDSMSKNHNSSELTTSKLDTALIASSIVTLDVDFIGATENSPIVNSTVDSFNLSPMSESDQLSDDDLALGASASPTEPDPMYNTLGTLAPISMTEEELYQKVFAKVPADRNCSDSSTDKQYYSMKALPPPSEVSPTQTAGKGHVGLVNQAMTCYLNSLLQSLFMTPEFRNALYNWESDNDCESKNIPYQLQKLFLNLQTSKKLAIETTDLTRSFGWDSTEAWEQHDVQELCRVMFDALEHKFKNTKQANLISNLYEGKMIDYVKCLECNTEKTRDDTFLDIPLPVRPYGSNVAYGSIVEALRAFVQPETLDGSDQYFCEKCNKKCDAHKGLKFKKFPYILTLHLKRFAFDYQTMHRIKLNDKVTFPQALNLSTFINATGAQTFVDSQESTTATTNGEYILNGVGLGNTNDDCADTTDSGSAMEEDNCSSGIATTASSSQHENDMNEDDEGIDMSTSTDHRPINTNENNEQRVKQESGPYLYELFAIMIHSGSVSGGHYYAYIKDFQINEWFCFNDQNVTPITQDDIQKTFGGGPTKAYYSAVYSSSTNAYMLMYRQIDPKRNERVVSVLDFPAHINTLLTKLQLEDEMRIFNRIGRHIAVADPPELIKPRIYFYHPTLRQMQMARVYVSRNFDYNTVLDTAYRMLNLEEFTPLSSCRLVAYESSSEEILQSFENETDPSLTNIRTECEGVLDFLLEYRGKDQKLEIYERGGCTWHVFMVNLASMAMDGPFLVHSSAYTCNDVLRHSIALRLNIEEDTFILAALPRKVAFIAHDTHPTKEAQEHLLLVAKAQFRCITYLYVNVPNLESANLELIGIPAFETETPAASTVEGGTDVVDAVLMNGGLAQTLNCESPIPPTTPTTASVVEHESNSEDSSLSDGDRTLVESLENRNVGYLTPEDVARLDSLDRVQTLFNHPSQSYEHDSNTSRHNARLYFHAIKIDAMDNTTTDSATTTTSQQSAGAGDEVARRPAHAYKILADSKMLISTLKQHIEELIRVPGTYFRLQRKHDSSDQINMDESLIFLNEGETLIVDLGKTLQPDEQKVKIYYMRLSQLEQQVENIENRLPCICEWIYNSTTTTAAEAKCQLIAKLQRIDDAKYQTLTLDNCRLWLYTGRNPVRILADDEILPNDALSSLPSEFLIQECENDIKPQTSENSLTIFVRRWHPDKMQLDNFQELTLEKNTEIKQALAEISDIPEEHISYCKINSSFPCTKISVLSVNSAMYWLTTAATLDKSPLNTAISGHVFFYKDLTLMPKELTFDERRELGSKEKIRLDRLGGITTSIYSPRRERALKIYVDTPQVAAPSLFE